MDLMDVNEVLEVPDTPDRLASSTHDKNCINASMNNRKTSKDCINGRTRNQQMDKGKSVTINGSKRLFIHPDKPSSFKHPRPNIDTKTHDKGKALCNSDVNQKFTHQEGGQNGHRVINAPRKGSLSLNHVHTTDSSDRSNSNKPVKLNTTSVDFLDKVNHKGDNNAPCTSSKAPQRKMLVRNGCISPHNIAKNKQVTKNHENGNVVKDLEQSGSSVVDIMDLVSEDNKDLNRCKGKGVLHHHHSSSKDLNAERIIHKEPSSSWRTPHNNRKEREIGQVKKGNEQNLDELKMVCSSIMSPCSVNRQKEGTSRNVGKRCVSIVDDSIGESSSLRVKRSKNGNGVGPSNLVPEVVQCDDVDSSVRDLQVEADEMLARELQEQLYNEEMTPGIHEMDSHLALAMPAQQNNNSSRGRRANRRQAPSSLTSQPSGNSRVGQRAGQPQSRMSELRSQFRSRPQRIPSNSNRRNSIFPPNMDVDMRMQILETLEAVGDIRRPTNRLLQIGREFNEDDYEMLLALDDDNHQHGGATPAQINNLPESKVQAENLQECSICLETPSIGETIRHLPCLHRFHKECIDEWLRRKTLCPVCKSSIA